MACLTLVRVSKHRTSVLIKFLCRGNAKQVSPSYFIQQSGLPSA